MQALPCQADPRNIMYLLLILILKTYKTISMCKDMTQNTKYKNATLQSSLELLKINHKSA